jgi:phosphodiesterase/alkaline phosphatase D-like protein
MPSNTFPNGVSAGDATQTEAVLWARSSVPGPVEFTISTSPDFSSVVGRATVSVDDPTVPAKVLINNLTPGTTYYYQVSSVALGDAETGRFETSAPAGVHAGLHFGVSGDWRGDLAPFPAIANADERGLDFFVKHGDTIYADIPSPAGPEPQAETPTEFRAKHAEVYGTTLGMNNWADLQHTTAILAVIDDHEVTNDFAGGAPPSSDPRFAGSTAQFINDTPLYENGLDAFLDYSAIRDQSYGASGDPRFDGEHQLYRYNAYGADAATFMLDTRSFRDAPLAAIDPTDPADIARLLTQSFEPDRTLLGRTQLNDLKHDLADAEARGITWKFVMLPEPIQNLTVGDAQDRYEGYAAERTDLLRFIDQNSIDNVVFVSADVHGTFINNLTYQERPFGPQIPTAAFEITTGPVAANAFGPDVVNGATAAGILPPIVREFYDHLPIHPDPGGAIDDKDDFVKAILNTQDTILGYDRLGLDDNLPVAEGRIDATLIQGDYVAAHTYGWTEFDIDAQSQQLRVTTWGIEPYTAEDLRANPGSVIARTPHIVSEFIVNPHPGGSTVTGNQPDGGAGANLLGELAKWQDIVEDIGSHSISELAQHIAGDSAVAALIPDAGNLIPLLGIPETLDRADFPFL